MNYKKRYKEALERAVLWHKSVMAADKKAMVEDLFPELKESEDESMRKALYADIRTYIPNERGDKYIAWLEKQGKPKDKGEISDGYHTFNELYRYRMLYNAAFFNMLPKEIVHKSKRHHDGEDCFGGGWFIVMANLPTGQISNHYELKDWDLFQIPEKEIADEWDGHTPQEVAKRLHKYLLEKQGEQPTDKIKPKFKVGDWVVSNNNGEVWQIGAQYTNEGQRLYLYNVNDVIMSVTLEELNNDFHLWTIQDAKDGDVLHSTGFHNDCIFIFNGLDNWRFDEPNGDRAVATGYCCLSVSADKMEFSIQGPDCVEVNTIKPATKIQRDLLFQIVKDAGYEWNADKKELKRIELNLVDKVWEKFMTGD